MDQPAQTKLNNKMDGTHKFKWKYDVKLGIFPSSPIQEVQVGLTVGKGDTLRKAYSVPIQTLDFLVFMNHHTITIVPGEDVKVSYLSKENNILKIKES